MTVDKVLENWSDYDAKKARNGSDPAFFSCDEAWEIYFLKDRIRREYPFINELKIFEAIESCCSRHQKPRKEFVQAVLMRLGFG